MTLTESELQELLKRAAKEGVKEYKKEKDRQDRKNKYHNTFLLMKSYRDATFHIENAVSEASQLSTQNLTAEEQQTYLRSIRRTRFQTMMMTAHIDKALEEVARRKKNESREVEYKAFELYFFDGLNYEQIAEILNTGKNTPRRWVTGIINEMSVLLWGLEDNR